MSTIPAEIVANFPSLILLNATESDVSSLENLRFNHLQNLMHLDLSKNSIKKIPEGIFEKCNAIEVNLRQNQLIELETDAFNGLTQLLRLDLSFNRIVRLEENVFLPLKKVKELRLNNNCIDIIDGKLFTHNVLLEELDLSNNSISVIVGNAFESLKHLISLNIGNNLFPSINLMPMERLQRVNVVNCTLTALALPDSVTDVMAFGNRITHVNTSTDSNLTSLMVGKNGIVSLDDIVNHRKLENLELSYNNIPQLDLMTLARMTQLKDLLIYGIKLNKLDANFVLTHFPNMHIIELSPKLYDQNELEEFSSQLHGRKIIVMSEGGKVINDNFKGKKTSNAPIKVATEDVTTGPTTMGIESKDNKESDLDRERQLTDRIRRLEQIIQSSDGRQRAELQYKQSIDDSMHSLRVMIVATICAFSLFIAFQVFVFVRNNYTRLRIQTSTMLINGRARSHEPMLEEVL